MCGICGIIDIKNKLAKDTRNSFVQDMNQAILHRGPDEGGHYQDDISALAMRRLSIIDLSSGQQPIFNETKDIGVFFNGEIYNYPDLRTDLIQKGHHFKTQSDTEVLVHLYEDLGTKMLPLLKGMFTFCLFDKKKKNFLLAKDRFGEKPLFYHHQDGKFSFSSEIKSLLADKSIPRKLNQEALPYYFRTSLLPEPMTMFEGIFSLPPGHFIQINATGEISIKKYFDLQYQVDKNIKTEEQATAFIRPILEQAVQRQTISDVPIGAFLSGGIDSSTIVALLQKNASKPIQTFTARFEDQAYDESTIARKVADYCGTQHHEMVVPNYDFTEEIFWMIIDHVGQPFRDSSAIPSFLITQEIRKHVKVALSGDGGDELFGGYSVFQWYQKISDFQKIPRLIRQIGQYGLQVAQQVPLINNISKIRQIQRGVSTSLEALDDIPIALNAFFNESEIQQLFQQNVNLDFLLLKKYPAHIRNSSALRKIMFYRTQYTLPANMLVKIDRMSMANSLEVRAPFLDPDLFDAAAKLPDKFLLKNGKGKHIIRKIMEKELPPEVFNHPKMGFSIPLHQYQNTAFKNLARRLLFEENPWPDLFEPAYLQQIYREGLEIKQDTAQKSVFQASHQLWMMMQLLGWAQRFGVGIASF